MWHRFVALGDSFTEGVADVIGPDGRYVGWADRMAASLARDTPDFEYANLAVRGRLLPQVVSEQVPLAIDLAPDLVSLAAGVNDVLRRSWDLHTSATLLEGAVRDLRGSGADVLVFAFGDPTRRSRVMGSVSARIATYNAATRAIAENYGAMVVDFWGSAAFDDDLYWDADRLHLSPAGHTLAARAAMQALGVGSDAWRTPAPPQPAPSMLESVRGHAQWASGHFAPWMARRLRGRSSGDGITPKRPGWGPAPADAYAVQVP